MMHAKISAAVPQYHPLDLETDLIDVGCKAEAIEVMVQVAEESFLRLRDLYQSGGNYGEWRIVEVLLREVQDIAHRIDDATALIRNKSEAARGA